MRAPSRPEGGLVTWESVGDGWSGTDQVLRLVDRRQIVEVRDRRLAGRQQRQVRNKLGRSWAHKLKESAGEPCALQRTDRTGPVTLFFCFLQTIANTCGVTNRVLKRSDWTRSHFQRTLSGTWRRYIKNKKTVEPSHCGSQYCCLVQLDQLYGHYIVQSLL